MSESPTPYAPRERTRLSTSTSISTPENRSNENNQRVGDSEVALDTYALASAIGKLWNVDDPDLVVMQFGGSAVAKAHRRMLYMSRQQKLAQVRSLEDYFMSILIGRAPVVDDRSDEHYEEYLRLRAARGAK